MREAKNPQDILVESTEGIYIVDAGAGTGKTHTIIRRYEKLIKDGVLPKEILLITFTRNAADQMREDVISSTDTGIPVTDFLEAPILNFHALCTKILKKSGADSPKHLGISEMLAGNFNILESRYYEGEFFGKFFTGFKKKTLQTYKHIYSALNEDPKKVLNAIKQLCNRGIFPMKSGWFIDGHESLKGNYEMYSEKFDEMNKVVMHKTQKARRNQNKLYKILSEVDKRVHLDFIFKEMILDKEAHPGIKDDMFKDGSQDELIEFMKNVYHSYIEFMLRRNVLNFDFVVMFAFLVLYNDDKVREENRYEYIMVDEFQDTDEIQFQLLMLLVKNVSSNANIAVVGDWKQGIYGFRNTTIENITEFNKRLLQFKKILNTGRERITFDVSEEKIKKIVLEYNYRSSQKILDLSRGTLFCRGKSDEEFDTMIIAENFKEPLKAKRELDDITEIGFYQTKEKDINEEVELVLKKISFLINDDKYKVREFGSDGKVLTERKIKYSDICVLSRSKSFGLKLQKAGIRNGIPVNFGGGLELFASEPGIIVLAWLRLMLNDKNAKAWVPVYEKEGYNYNEIQHLLRAQNSADQGLFKNKLEKFLDELKERKDNIIFLVEFILKRYEFDDEFGNAIINEISKWSKSDLISIGELVHLIENSAKETFNIELNKTSNAVVSQTIHSVKGLEFPVVIVANCNSRIFPDVKNITNDIFFHPATGLRFRKIYTCRGKYHFSFDNWRSEVLMRMCKTENYDEERRLLYVAATRAKQYLYFTASNPSTFFTELAENTGHAIFNNFEYEIKPHEVDDEKYSEEISFPVIFKPSKKFVSVHSLMGLYEIEESNVNEQSSLISRPDAIEYGIRVHNIAHKLANGFELDLEIEEVKNIKKFISGLNPLELKTETDFLFPKDDEVIRGTIDVLAIYSDRVEVIDYKTDKNRNYLDRYRVQIEIYKEVVKSIYKDKKVTGKIFFVSLNEVIEM
ncbi:MAG: ATP-dependent helicase [Bacteroidota bacterium]|nr:ATP-dependent helicase [Bacteroidota bacterium]